MRKTSLKKDGLNVIPLIDVMLVLLCIVLSISTFIAQGKISVELPKSKSGVKENDPNSKRITIDSNSTIFYEDRIVTKEELEDELSKIDAKTLVVLQSDKGATFESFVSVIDALKVNSHENFAIVTEVRK